MPGLICEVLPVIALLRRVFPAVCQSRESRVREPALRDVNAPKQGVICASNITESSRIVIANLRDELGTRKNGHRETFIAILGIEA